MDDNIFVSAMSGFYAIHNYSGYVESFPEDDENAFYEHELGHYSEEQIRKFVKICFDQNPASHDTFAGFFKQITCNTLPLNVWSKVKDIPVVFYYSESLVKYSWQNSGVPTIQMEWKLFSKIDYLFHLFEQTTSNLDDILFSDRLTDSFTNAFTDLALWSSTKTILPPPDLIKFLPLDKSSPSVGAQLSLTAKSFWLLCEYGHILMNHYYAAANASDDDDRTSSVYIFSVEGEISADIFAIDAISNAHGDLFENIILSIGILLRFIAMREALNEKHDTALFEHGSIRIQRWDSIKVFAGNRGNVAEKIRQVDAVFDFLQNR